MSLDTINQLDVTDSQREKLAQLFELNDTLKNLLDDYTYGLVCDVQQLSLEVIEEEIERRFKEQLRKYIQ